MSRQIIGSLEYPAGTNFNGVIEARNIEGSDVIIPQSVSTFDVSNSLYDFTLENGAYQFAIVGILEEGSTVTSKVKIGLGIVNDGTPIDLLTLIGLSEPLSGPVEDLIDLRGVPSGGLTGQHLAKTSDSDYDTEWVEGGIGEAPVDGMEYARKDAGWVVVTGGGGGSVVSVNGKTGVVVLDKTDIGLGQVDNTSDLNKPISNATQTALDDKVDKIAGKGLSTEDYTTVEKTKLSGIETGAEVNVQSDWTQTVTTEDSFILNKPFVIPEAPEDGQQYARQNATWTTVDAGGVGTFLELTDTPADYTGQSGMSVVVNVGEDGLEFSTAGMAAEASVAEIEAGTEQGKYISPFGLRNLTKISIGNQATVDQGLGSIAIGDQAGNTSQATGAVALGVSAGNSNQESNAVAIGTSAGLTTQGQNSVAVGFGSGNAQGDDCVAVGRSSGSANQGNDSVAVGTFAGSSSQSASAVATGDSAGRFSQGSRAVAVGHDAGNSTQGSQAVAVGDRAGVTSQGGNAVAIGVQAGNSGQGVSAIALGANAGQISQEANGVHIKTPDFDFEYLPSTKTLDVRNTVGDLNFTVNGNSLGGFNPDLSFNLFENAWLENTNTTSDWNVTPSGTITLVGGTGNSFASVKPKWMVPRNTYFEFGVIESSNTALSSKEVRFAPITESGIKYDQGFAVSLSATLVGQLLKVDSGSTPQNRSYSNLGSPTSATTVGGMLRVYTTYNESIGNVTVFLSSDGVTVFQSPVSVPDGLLGWDLEIVDRVIVSVDTEVLYNFGQTPFLGIPPASTTILSGSQRVNDSPVLVWTGSSASVANTLTEYPMGVSGSNAPAGWVNKAEFTMGSVFTEYSEFTPSGVEGTESLSVNLGVSEAIVQRFTATLTFEKAKLTLSGTPQENPENITSIYLRQKGE